MKVRSEERERELVEVSKNKEEQVLVQQQQAKAQAIDLTVKLRQLEESLQSEGERNAALVERTKAMEGRDTVVITCLLSLCLTSAFVSPLPLTCLCFDLTLTCTSFPCGSLAGWLVGWWVLARSA